MPVQIDAYLDPMTGDLPEVSRHTTGLELIQQRIRLRLVRGDGEWFLDPVNVGLPLIAWREQKPPDMQEIVGRIQQEIREVPGVSATLNFSGVHDNQARRVTITGDVLTRESEVTSIVVTGTTQSRNAMVFASFFSSGNVRGATPRPTNRGA